MVTSVNTSYDLINAFVNDTTEARDATIADAAVEFGLYTPDATTAEFLTLLAARAQGASELTGTTPTGIIMSPSCGLIGLHLFAGAPSAHLTCIEPEVQFQNLARSAFTAAGQRPNTFRFLPSRPLEVAGRLASDSYDLAVAESAIEDLQALADATLPTLRPGGSLVILDTLLDGLIGDDSRTDRQTIAAREADAYFRSLEQVTVTRLPLGAGMTILTKSAPPQQHTESSNA